MSGTIQGYTTFFPTVSIIYMQFWLSLSFFLEPSARVLNLESTDHCDGPPSPEIVCKYFKVCVFLAFFRSSIGFMSSKRMRITNLVFTSCLLKYGKFRNLKAVGAGGGGQQRISNVHRVSDRYVFSLPNSTSHSWEARYI